MFLLQNDCANLCTDRYVSFNQKLMMTFVENQNKKNKDLEEAMKSSMAPTLMPQSSEPQSSGPT